MNKRTRDYSHFLQRLHAYERFEPLPKSRGPEKLDAVRDLAAQLGNPERACRVVHVAGTNGKGTTASMIARLLQTGGFRTGLYTSPHVLDVRERIALDGAPIAEAVFAQAGHAVLDLADRQRESVHFSYFDLLTLIALVAFREQSMEWAVLEVGLGGLSDATNIGPKELCVLTRIGMDHLHVLGDTLEAIATQKLGIVPPGVATVLAEQDAALEPWLRARLAERGSRVHPAIPLWVEPRGREGEAIAVQCRDGIRRETPPGSLPINLPRLASAGTALAAADLLLGFGNPEQWFERLRTALAVGLPGRLELRRRQAVLGRTGAPLETIVLDGGHNAEAVTALHQQLGRWSIGRYTLILGLQRDKLVGPLRGPMADLLADAERVVTLAPQTVRAPDAAELETWLRGVLPEQEMPPLETVADARAALEAVARTPQQPVVIAGSFWMLGDVMRLLSDATPASRPAAGTP